MSQSTVEIHLSARERRRLLPGLEHLVNGLGSFIYLGSTPNANPSELIHLRPPAIHEDRQFDLEFSEWVLYVRNQVKWPTQSCKFHFTEVEFSILALAARVTRRLRKASSRASRPLQDKLETFRKRAKRAAIAELGEQEYKETTLKWRHFLSWMRFYLLCFRMPLPPGTVKMIWRDQRSQLAVLIKNAISEMSDALVPDSTICWLAGLLKAELRPPLRDIERNAKERASKLAGSAQFSAVQVRSRAPQTSARPCLYAAGGSSETGTGGRTPSPRPTPRRRSPG